MCGICGVVALGRPARTAELPCTALAGTLQLTARCDTHRHVLFGLMSAGTRSIEVQLAGGRVLLAGLARF